MGNEQSFQQVVLGQLYIYMWKNKVGPLSYIGINICDLRISNSYLAMMEKAQKQQKEK